MTGWPDSLRGVTESIVATRGPNDKYNYAALGLHAGTWVTARTWGNTRTRRNFQREESGYVQFSQDPVLFVEAALGIVEFDDPVHDTANAWVLVDVSRVDSGEANGTDWVDWRLQPEQSEVDQRVVPVINRGFNAVIEATVAASRLDVPAFDDADLRERLSYFRSVVESCGGERAQEAMDRVDDYASP